MRDEVGVHDVPVAAVRGMRDGLRRDTVAALLAADRGELRVRLLPEVTDGSGRPYHALEMSSPDLDPFVFYVDPQTNLIVKQTFVVGGRGRPLVEEIFSDYHPVNDIQVVFRVELRWGSRPQVQRRVTDFAVNPSIDPLLFERPAS